MTSPLFTKNASLQLGMHTVGVFLLSFCHKLSVLPLATDNLIRLAAQLQNLVGGPFLDSKQETQQQKGFNGCFVWPLGLEGLKYISAKLGKAQPQLSSIGVS